VTIQYPKIHLPNIERKQTVDSKYGVADSKKQRAAESRQQTANNSEQTADSRQ
jgi:hypothetical protein